MNSDNQQDVLNDGCFFPVEKAAYDEKVDDHPPLGPHDVICGRCSAAYNNVGNRRFRVTIFLNIQRYMDAPTRPKKGEVISSVVKIFQNDIGAKFFKYTKDKKFVEINDKLVRQKVGHALRDMAVQRAFGGGSMSFNSSRRSSMSSIKSAQSTRSDPKQIRSMSMSALREGSKHEIRSWDDEEDDDFCASEVGIAVDVSEVEKISSATATFPDFANGTPETPARLCIQEDEFDCMVAGFHSLNSLLSDDDDVAVDLSQAQFIGDGA
jgi:hypothetical protein